MATSERTLLARVTKLLDELVRLGDIELVAGTETKALARSIVDASEDGALENGLGEWLLERDDVEEVFIEPADLRRRFDELLTPPSNPEARAVAAKAAAARVGAELPDILAAIAKDPRDLDTRAVYADWLSEKDDPRGELMVLQLEEANPTTKPTRLRQVKKRIKEVLLENRRYFFAELSMEETTDVSERVAVEMAHGFFKTAKVFDEHNLRILLGLESSRFLEELAVRCRAAAGIDEAMGAKQLPVALRRFELHSPMKSTIVTQDVTRAVGRFDLKVLRNVPHLESIVVSTNQLRVELEQLPALVSARLDAETIEFHGALPKSVKRLDITVDTTRNAHVLQAWHDTAKATGAEIVVRNLVAMLDI